MANIINISQILMKRGNTTAAGNYIGPLGELVVDTGLQTIRVQDGVTPGGMAVLATLSGYNQLSGNIANLQTTTANISANLSAFQTYANTATANLGANLSAFQTYANTTFGTSSFGNADVAAYLTTNPQGGQYSNANVASYLTASNIITGIDANVTAANLQITNLWSNAGVQSANIATLVANAGVQADAIAGANAAIITANTALKGYVDTQLSTLTNGASTALDTLLEIGTALGNNANFSATMITWLGNVTTNTTAANTAIDTLQANLGGYYTWANANVAGLYGSITAANTAWQANAGVQADAITTLTTNAAFQSANIATVVANAGVQADAITSLTANAGVQSANIATLFSNAGVQADAITSLQANITAANLAIAAAIGTYSNTNVAAYLSASTTGNVGAGNLTVINNFNSNIISANSFTYANGVSILAGIVGTYSNTNVSVYLSSQNITGANIGGLYNSITGANTVIQTLSANVGGFYTWANANFGTSSYSNANVASYLVANPQGGNYSNVNVAAYIAGNLSTINANITGANAAIVTANSAVVSYVNTLNTAMSSNVAGANAAIVTANTAMKVYVDAGNTTMTSYVGNQVTTANTALKGYVDAGNTTMTSYVGNQVTTANTAMKSYVDAGNTTQSNQINSINANIGSYYTWANANVAGLSGQITGANAVISALQANVGSYYTWANANVATQQTSINSLATGANTNTAAYLAAGISTNVTTTGNVSAGNVFVNGQPTTYGTVNPAYMVVGLASSVSGFGSGSTVIFDTVVGNTNSQTSYNASTGVFTLTAGVTYDMSFTPSFITFTNSTTGYLCYQWVDATTNTPLDSTGTGIGTGISSQDTTAQQDNLTARVIYTPSTNQTVKLLVTSGNGTAVLRGSIGTQAVIKPLNPTIAVQATATGTVSATVVANTSPNTTTTTGGSSTLPALTVLTVAIPGAGTWRLDAELRVYIPGAGYMAAAFYNNGTLIPGSEYFVAAGGVTQTGAATGQYSGFMSYNLTTTGATTVTMGFWSTTSSQFISSGDGRTWLQATQIDSIFALNTLATMSVTGNVTAGNIISNGNIAMVSNIARNVYVNSYAPSSTQGNVGDIWYQTF